GLRVRDALEGDAVRLARAINDHANGELLLTEAPERVAELLGDVARCCAAADVERLSSHAELVSRERDDVRVGLSRLRRELAVEEPVQGEVHRVDEGLDDASVDRLRVLLNDALPERLSPRELEHAGPVPAALVEHLDVADDGHVRPLLRLEL